MPRLSDDDSTSASSDASTSDDDASLVSAKGSEPGDQEDHIEKGASGVRDEKALVFFILSTSFVESYTLQPSLLRKQHLRQSNERLQAMRMLRRVTPRIKLKQMSRSMTRAIMR